MTAAVAAGNPSVQRGIRPVEPRRDMAALAGLIERAFSDRLDASSRRMILGMKMFAQAGRLGWLIGRWFLPPAAYPQGFVWEEDGEVVGNASLLPVRGFQQRWVMANVVVKPEYQRRGIARALVVASIDLVRRCGGRRIMLQVDRDNQGARTLYENLEFKTLTTRTTWVRKRNGQGLHAGSHGKVRPRVSGEWSEQWALVKRLHPEGLLWPFPTVASLFRPSGFENILGLGKPKHWVWEEAGRLVGVVSIRPEIERWLWRLMMVVEPEWRGEVESSLLSVAMHESSVLAGNFILDYPSDVAPDKFEGLGFKAIRELTWMGLKLEKSDI
ncbi:MAG: GNAT family N-acetyltransferase [Anaerolineales bacterium]|nr:MAG: GNAT family N-acetyltransferase [Anaerolineales bacterium]